MIMAVEGERKASTDEARVFHLNGVTADKRDESQNASMKNSYAFGQGTYQQKVIDLGPNTTTTCQSSIIIKSNEFTPSPRKGNLHTFAQTPKLGSEIS